MLINSHRVAAGIPNIVRRSILCLVLETLGNPIARRIVAELGEAAVGFAHLRHFAVHRPVYLGDAFLLIFRQIADLIVGVVVPLLTVYVIAVVTRTDRIFDLT